MDREVRDLVRDLERHGWTVKQGKHVKLTPPGGGRPVCISGTPSDHARGMQNALADLRRALRRT